MDIGTLLLTTIFWLPILWLIFRRRDDSSPDMVVPGLGVSGMCWVRPCLWCDEDVYHLLIEGPSGPWRHYETMEIEGRDKEGAKHKAEPYLYFDPAVTQQWREDFANVADDDNREVVNRVPINEDHEVVTARSRKGPYLRLDEDAEEYKG